MINFKLIGVVIAAVALLVFASCQEPKLLPVLGKDPVSDLIVVEDHGQVLVNWAEQGTRDAVLINIDTHDDIRWIPPSKINVLQDIYKRQDWKAFRESDSISDNGLYDVGNWIYAGARLGMFKEIYWVIPYTFFSDEVRAGSPEDRKEKLRGFLLSSKFSVQDVETFKLHENRFEGMFQGIPFTVCGLESLPVIEEPVMLSIDSDFFPLYSDNYRASYLTSLHNMFTALYSKGYRVSKAVVSHSVNGNFLPPHLRWVSDTAAMIFSDPGSLDRDPSELTNLLQLVDNAYRTRNYGEMLKYTEHYYSRYPEASLMLYKAYAFMLQGEIDRSLEAATESCRSDMKYCNGLPYIGSIYFAQNQCRDAVRFYSAAYSEEPGLKNGHFIYAHCLRDDGNMSEAIEHYKKDISINGSFPSDFLIFETYLLSGKKEDAIRALETAVNGLSRNPYAEVINERAASAVYAAIDYIESNNIKGFTGRLLGNRTVKQMFIDYPRP